MAYLHRCLYRTTKRFGIWYMALDSDSGVHAGRSRTLEILIPTDKISIAGSSPKGLNTGMWRSLLVCLLDDTRLGPDHKCSWHGILQTRSSTSSIWHRSRATLQIYLYVSSSHTTIILYLTEWRNIRPNSDHILSLSSPATIYISRAMPLQMHATLPSVSLKRDICHVFSASHLKLSNSPPFSQHSRRRCAANPGSAKTSSPALRKARCVSSR